MNHWHPYVIAILDSKQKVDFSLTLLYFVLYVHSTPPNPNERRATTIMTTVPPTVEERLARLEGVYDHLASKADIAELRAILKDDVARVESDLKGDIARVESGLKGDIAHVQTDIAELKGSVKILLVAMTSGLALLNIVLRFWPS